MSEQQQQNQQHTTDMRRADSAWGNVDHIMKITAHENDEERKKKRGKYGSRAKDIGALIMTTGLGAALAFLRSKATAKDQMPQLLYKQISDWVISEVKPSEGSDLLALLMKSDTAYYRRATTEALAYIVWLKRFVEAEFKTELEAAQAEGTE